MTYTRKARPRKLSAALGLATAAALVVLPSPAMGAGSGGVGMGGTDDAPPSGTTTPGSRAKLKNGFAIPPADAPLKPHE